MATTTVTIPPALAFLVSNFHSLVNIKLDASNYLLWKTQVENVLDANGFLGYVDGSVTVPPAQIRNATEAMVTNPAYALYKLIDSQILSCLTASISQTTLSYVLGLRNSHQVWVSLGSRYNSVSRSHVHELRSSLYNHTKTSTMESYIDGIKSYAQKLAGAASPLSDEKLVFHALHGLPSVFNGFKTGIRTRGETLLTFDELVTMLNGEELQMSKDHKDEVSTVLVASHGSGNGLGSTSGSSQSIQFQVSPHTQGSTQSTSQQFYPQQQLFPQQQARDYNRGRNTNRGSRFQRQPCDICGRTNHTTNYCYYRDQNSGQQWRNTPNSGGFQGPGVFQMSQQFPYGFVSPGLQGSGHVVGQSYSVQNGLQGGNQFLGQPQFVGQPMGQPHFVTQPQFVSQPQFQGLQSQPSHFQSVQPQNNRMQPQNVSPTVQFTVPSGAFSNVTPTSLMTTQVSVPSGNTQACFGGFTGSSPYPQSQPSTVLLSDASKGNQWYFDSGATAHVTHNLQNIEQPQVSNMGDGVMVGNGNQLHVAHTGQGQDYTSNPLQGPLHTGTLSSSELL